jgi:DNA recombination protein RmuC
MFIPVEPAYILAVQADPDLWAYAYTRRILMISPTNLIAVLKIVADLWKRELLSKNHKEIAAEGGKLYDKFVGFIESIEEIGKHLTKSQESYTRVVNQLKDGRGNLISRVQKLKKLGAKITDSKQLPNTMLTADSDDDDETGLLQEEESVEE